MSANFSKLLTNKTTGQILFWCVMLLYHISSAWPHESDKVFLLERMLAKTTVQCILAYIFLLVLVPKFLIKKKVAVFFLLSVLTLYAAYVLHTAIRCYYLLPKYPDIYSYRPPLIFADRIGNVYAFLANITSIAFPAIVLLIIDFYRDQQSIAQLKEQKKSTELRLLKHQLNPHFLFNTLNNIYTLALKKSDLTADVIAKLSDILDYILFRCEKKYVPITNEISLLENYIALEKIRYGNRLDVHFDYKVTEDVGIAPLLLLTFVENAFKHGVSQALDRAEIDILLKADSSEILFEIKNSIPRTSADLPQQSRTAIGLTNIQQQLGLLYPNNHSKLRIFEDENSYKVNLKLMPHAL